MPARGRRLASWNTIQTCVNVFTVINVPGQTATPATLQVTRQRVAGCLLRLTCWRTYKLRKYIRGHYKHTHVHAYAYRAKRSRAGQGTVERGKGARAAAILMLTKLFIGAQHWKMQAEAATSCRERERGKKWRDADGGSGISEQDKETATRAFHAPHFRCVLVWMHLPKCVHVCVVIHMQMTDWNCGFCTSELTCSADVAIKQSTVCVPRDCAETLSAIGNRWVCINRISTSTLETKRTPD